MLEVWFAGFAALFDVHVMLALALGVFVGMVIGVLPGLGGTAALALLTPLTYGMDPIAAIAMAGGVMGSGPMGGSITSILLNTPGQNSQAVTCLDGFPLAQQGKAGMAIGASATANILGGLIGMVSVLICMPIAQTLVLAFGPPEFFLMSVLALVIVSTATRGKMLRGLITCALGLMIAFIGFNDVTGQERFTGGIEYLWDGVALVPALIGLFAIAEMMQLTMQGGSISKNVGNVAITGTREGVIATFKNWVTVVRGSLIGTFVGLVPGIGAGVATFVSYSMTVQADKHPETFGKGNIKGVIAPEAAINAKDGSAIIPTLAFGLPAGAEMAVFMGILVLHGMTPGPLMLAENQVEIYGLLWAITAACIISAIIGVMFASTLAKITLIDSQILAPAVMVLALAGSYAVDMDILNPILALIFGVIGYLMIRFDYPRLGLVIAVVLGEIAERNFHQTEMMSSGDPYIYFNRPVSAVIIGLIVLTLCMPALKVLRKRMRAKQAVEGRMS